MGHEVSGGARQQQQKAADPEDVVHHPGGFPMGVHDIGHVREQFEAQHGDLIVRHLSDGGFFQFVCLFGP